MLSRRSLILTWCLFIFAGSTLVGAFIGERVRARTIARLTRGYVVPTPIVPSIPDPRPAPRPVFEFRPVHEVVPLSARGDEFLLPAGFFERWARAGEGTNADLALLAEPGRRAGLRISPEPRSVYAALGFEPGDVLEEVNGLELTSYGRAFELEPKALDARILSFTFRRAGVRRSVRFLLGGARPG